jgi:hypothetical protein
LSKGSNAIQPTNPRLIGGHPEAHGCDFNLAQISQHGTAIARLETSLGT